MGEKATLKRYLIFLAGVFICACGIALLSRSALGTSALSSVSFVLFLATGVSAGAYTFGCNMVFWVVDALLRKKLGWMQWLQIPATLIFSVCINFWLELIPSQFGGEIPMQIVYMCLGCPIMALGIALEVFAGVTILPGEGIVKTLAEKSGMEFGNVKVGFDCVLTLIAAILAFVFFGRLNGVGIGTLVSAVAVGQFVRLYSHKLGKFKAWVLK